MVFKTKRMRNSGYLANGKEIVDLPDGLTHLVGEYNQDTKQYSVEKVMIDRISEKGEEIRSTYDVTQMSSYDKKRFMNAAYAGIHDDELIFGGRFSGRIEELAEKGIIVDRKVKKAKGPVEPVYKKDLKTGAGYEAPMLYNAREAYAEKVLKEHQKTPKGVTSSNLFSKAVNKIGKLFGKNAEVDKEPMTKEKAMEMARNVVNYESAVQNLTWENLPAYLKNGKATVQDLFEYAGAATELIGRHIKRADKVKALVNGKKYKPELTTKKMFSEDETETLTQDNFDLYAGLLVDFKPTVHRSECTGASYTVNGRLEDIVEDGINIKAEYDNDSDGNIITKYTETSPKKSTIIGGVAAGVAGFLAAWGLSAALDSNHGGLGGLLGIHVDKEIKEKGTMDFQSWLNKTASNNAKIVMTYDNLNNTYTLVGTGGNGTVVTTPYTIPAQYLNGSGQINKEALKLTFFKNGTVNNNTYQLNLTEKMTLNDLSNAIIRLSGEQHGRVNSTDMHLYGSKNCKIYGEFDGNLSKIDNATGYLNITSGHIKGNGNVTNFNLTDGKGIVNFNNTKIEGNMTGYLNLTQVSGADIKISGGNGTYGYVNGSKAGYVYFLNGQDPVWVEGNETLRLTENMTFVGKLNGCSVQGWTKLFAGKNMTVTGNGNITDFDLINGTGKMDINMTVHDLKGYISNFTIPKTEMKGRLDLNASKIDLLGRVNATLNGLWNGNGTFAKINNNMPLGNLSGYAVMNLEQMLKATGFGNDHNVTISNISLKGNNLTIGADTGYFKYNTSDPLKLTLDAQNSKITYNGDLVKLNMTGNGTTESNWKLDFKTPNPYTAAIVPVTTIGALIGYTVGANKQRVEGNMINQKIAFYYNTETERKVNEAKDETKEDVKTKTKALNDNVNKSNTALLAELQKIGSNVSGQITSLEQKVEATSKTLSIGSAASMLTEPIVQPQAEPQTTEAPVVDAAKPADNLLEEKVEDAAEEAPAQQKDVNWEEDNDDEFGLPGNSEEQTDEQGESEEGSNEAEDHKVDLHKI